MSSRLSCAVPFCRRWRGDRKDDPVSAYSEWICGDHWRLVDRRLRRLFKRMQRRLRAGALCASPHRLHDYVWERMKRQAIERALP